MTQGNAIVFEVAIPYGHPWGQRILERRSGALQQYGTMEFEGVECVVQLASVTELSTDAERLHTTWKAYPPDGS
jgi:hypothetical protein